MPLVDPDAPVPPRPAGQQQISVSVPESLKLGTYANFLVVSHSPHEFTLDFCQVLPSGDGAQVRAEVVSRVRIAPTMVGKVIQALNGNMTGYEDAFGMVREVG